ncbi:MAG TPA: polymer-forming cytoskeletal protein [Candidatus Dormibacteraeota bacterium]|jgi:cytoskeletal protein CcmA (bactofilin family)
MDVQEAVAESTPIEAAQDKKDGLRRFMMGPNDSLEGKLTYDGHVHVDGRAEGELRVSGNIEVASGAKVKALLEASNVTIKGDVEGALNARDKLVLGKNAKLSGDVSVRRLQIEDGASLNGHVRMGDFERQGSGG